MADRRSGCVRDGRTTPGSTFRFSRALVGAIVCVRVFGAAAVARADGVDGGDGSPSAHDGDAAETSAASGDAIPLNARPEPAPRFIATPPTRANETVVFAPKRPSAKPREDQTAAASVVIPSESPRAADDLGTLLLEVPGATVTRTGGFGSFSTVSLRGSNPDEVRIYLDGIPLNQAIGGAVDLSTLPLGDVERVEIYRGSAPIAFGESALGGVISISTRAPERDQARARFGGGSFLTAFADGSGARVMGPLKLYVGLHAMRARDDFPLATQAVAGGYQPTTRENNDLSQLDGVVRGTLALPGRRELRLGFIGLWKDQGLAAPDIYRATRARDVTARLLAHLDYTSRGDLGASSRLRAVVFASDVQDDFSDPLHEIVGVPTQTRDRTRTLGARATAEKSLGELVKVTAVAEGRAEDFLPRNVLDPAAPNGAAATRETGVVGTELDLHVPRLALDVLPSARLESTRDVRTGRDNFGAFLGPTPATTRTLPVLRLGLLRALPHDVVLKGNAGYYARIPSFLELYGYNRNVLGNPTLASERGLNGDVGVASTHGDAAGSVTTSATLFGARVDDLIAWETYGAQARAENVSRARVWGVELELRLRRGHFGATTQATFLDARDEGPIAADHDKQLPNHPRYHGYGRVEWREPFPRRRLVGVGYVDADGQAGDNWTSNSPLPARVLVGAGLAVEHPPSGLRLVASALNVGDSRVQDFPGYPLPGRSIFVSLEWSSASSDEEPTSGSSVSNP